MLDGVAAAKPGGELRDLEVHSGDPQPRLSFTNYRLVPGADYKDAKVWAGPWLERSQFAEHELPQLRRVFEEWGIRGSDPFTIPCDDFQGMAEVPLERWDVLNEAGVPHYSVWTYRQRPRSPPVVLCGDDAESVMWTTSPSSRARRRVSPSWPRSTNGRAGDVT